MLRARNRFRNGYNRNETMLYNYHHILRYSEDLAPEELNNLSRTLTSGFKEIIKVVVIEDPVKSSENVRIGKIEIDGNRKVRIHNHIEIKGDIASRGDIIQIGNTVGKVKKFTV